MTKLELENSSYLKRIAIALEKIARTGSNYPELEPSKDEEIEQLRAYIREIEGRV